jgi:hypothetical protein
VACTLCEQIRHKAMAVRVYTRLNTWLVFVFVSFSSVFLCRVFFWSFLDVFVCNYVWICKCLYCQGFYSKRKNLNQKNNNIFLYFFFCTRISLQSWFSISRCPFFFSLPLFYSLIFYFSFYYFILFLIYVITQNKINKILKMIKNDWTSLKIYFERLLYY